LSCRDFEEHNLSYQQWKSVLHLSTCWGFASIRKLALKFINPPTPHDRLMLARTYAVNQWVVPALTALCERADPLTLTEARPMRIEDIVLVAAVREEVRGRGRIDASKVTRIVEVALAGKLPRFEGDSASRPGLEGGVAKQGIRSTAAESHVDSEREDGNGPKYFVSSGPVGLKVARQEISDLSKMIDTVAKQECSEIARRERHSRSRKSNGAGASSTEI
jgi:hypothetical protein